MKKINITKKILLVFFISLLFKPLWLFNNSNLGQPADDMYHWIHSATIAYDQDINYVDDYVISDGTFNNKTNVPSAPPGAGYLSSPFVFIFSQFDNLTYELKNDFRINPTGSFGYLGFFFSGLFYTTFGFYLLRQLLEKNRLNGFVILSGFLSTLVHFVTTRFLMPHAIEFFLCSCIVYLFEKNTKKFNNKEYFTINFLYFLLAITRPSTFIYTCVLILIYRNKFQFNKIVLINYIPITGVFIYFYTSISKILYTQNYMLLNTYGSDMDAYSSTFTVEQILNGLVKLPNLFLSTSMGLLWSTPIVFLGLILFILNGENFKINKFLLLLYFVGSISPLLIWQGREVAYGQRLLIGIIPMCILIVSKNLKKFQILNRLLPVSTFITYVGYLFFYANDKLTLKPGVTLWGTEVGYAATNYYLELVKGLFNFEIIVSATLRNIYVVNLGKYLNMQEIFLKFNLFNFETNKIDNFLNYLNVYSELNTPYLITANVIIFCFSYLFVRLFFYNVK